MEAQLCLNIVRMANPRPHQDKAQGRVETSGSEGKTSHQVKCFRPISFPYLPLLSLSLYRFALSANGGKQRTIELT